MFKALFRILFVLLSILLFVLGYFFPKNDFLGITVACSWVAIAIISGLYEFISSHEKEKSDSYLPPLGLGFGRN